MLTGIDRFFYVTVKRSINGENNVFRDRNAAIMGFVTGSKNGVTVSRPKCIFFQMLSRTNVTVSRSINRENNSVRDRNTAENGFRHTIKKKRCEYRSIEKREKINICIYIAVEAWCDCNPGLDISFGSLRARWAAS